MGCARLVYCPWSLKRPQLLEEITREEIPTNINGTLRGKTNLWTKNVIFETYQFQNGIANINKEIGI